MRILLSFIACLLLAGCTSFVCERAQTGMYYLATDPAAVKIFNSKPSQSYITIGEIRAEGEMISSVEHIEKRLRENAAAMGGEAIILTKKDQSHGITTNGVAIGDTYAYNINDMFTKRLTAEVIRFNK